MTIEPTHGAGKSTALKVLAGVATVATEIAVLCDNCSADGYKPSPASSEMKP